MMLAPRLGRSHSTAYVPSVIVDVISRIMEIGTVTTVGLGSMWPSQE